MVSFSSDAALCGWFYRLYYSNMHTRRVTTRVNHCGSNSDAIANLRRGRITFRLPVYSLFSLPRTTMIFHHSPRIIGPDLIAFLMNIEKYMCYIKYSKFITDKMEDVECIRVIFKDRDFTMLFNFTMFIEIQFPCTAHVGRCNRSFCYRTYSYAPFQNISLRIMLLQFSVRMFLHKCYEQSKSDYPAGVFPTFIII